MRKKTEDLGPKRLKLCGEFYGFLEPHKFLVEILDNAQLVSKTMSMVSGCDSRLVQDLLKMEFFYLFLDHKLIHG